MLALLITFSFVVLPQETTGLKNSVNLLLQTKLLSLNMKNETQSKHIYMYTLHI